MMGKHVPDIHFTSIEVHSSDQTIFVAANIENNKVADGICRWKNSAKLGEVREITSFHQLDPTGKRHFAIGIPLPELP
jgi:hypothetical protein